MNTLTIGSLGAAAGVGVETIRYYQHRGLLPIPQRPGGIRRYGQDDLDRLHFIRHAQRLGFSLEEVAELLALDHMQDRQAARAQAESKLTQIDDRIRRMAAMREALASLVSCCENAPGSDPCPILRALAGKTHPT